MEGLTLIYLRTANGIFFKKTGLLNLPGKIFANSPNAVNSFARRNSFSKNLKFILRLSFYTGLNMKLP